MRSQTIERVFADAKEKHGMRYTTLRGLAQVTNWIRLKFAAMNLKKLALKGHVSPCFQRIFAIFSHFKENRHFQLREIACFTTVCNRIL
jgi:hypothetical protein